MEFPGFQVVPIASHPRAHQDRRHVCKQILQLSWGKLSLTGRHAPGFGYIYY